MKKISTYLFIKFWQNFMKAFNYFAITMIVLSIVSTFLTQTVSASSSTVNFRDDGIALFNNQPFFPIGLFYWFPNDNPTMSTDSSGEMTDIKNAGFNTIFLGGNRKELSYLDQAQNLGLKVVDYNAFFNNNVTNQYLSVIANHPSFLAWYGVDEPIFPPYYNVSDSSYSFNDGNSTLPNISHYYQQLWTNNVNNHPIWTIYSPGESIDEIRGWNSLSKTTVTGIDIYVAPPGQWNRPPWCSDTTLRCVGEMVDKIISASGSGKPIWMGLQGFYTSPEGYVGQVTFEQTRFMTYDAIVHGATGLFWWDYKVKTSDTIPPNDMWSSLVKIASELSSPEISAAILGTDRKINLTGYLKTLSTSDVSGTYQYKISTYESPSHGGNLTVTGFKPNADIVVLKENRSLQADSTGKITDNFDAWGVHIYREQATNAISGDLNADGKIDIFDYNLLLKNFGNTTCGNIADIDGNCKVDIFDYNSLVGNFGKTQ